MIAISPIRRALVCRDSAAAAAVSAPNYDEFQTDVEVWGAIQRRPLSVLRVTMAHCAVADAGDIGDADTDASLAVAASNFSALRAEPLLEHDGDLLFVYEITGPARPGVRQIGLGGLARTDQIRTEANPAGPIIRNEGIREPKARGRARLIEATGAIVGMVNNAVPDRDGAFANGLEGLADARRPDMECTAEDGFVHRVWLVRDRGEQSGMADLLGHQPEAYVADGNHRSAAAAMLGREHFLAVFFPMDRMEIHPYNRLLSGAASRWSDVASDHRALDDRFAVEQIPAGGAPFQPAPTAPPAIGVYARDAGWLRLTPRSACWQPDDASASIAHALVQRCLFSDLLGIADERDARIRYVGANRDAGWLAARVDEGEADLAITLPPVTMEQFAAVCREGGMMPPKSTWFVPKVRSGLVMALLEEPAEQRARAPRLAG